MKSIVITGATSFIGVHLIKEWIKEECCIYAVVRPNSKNIIRLPESNKIVVIERNMEQYDLLAKDIHSADYFYHLAWEGARVPYRYDRKIQLNNYACTISAFESANEMGCSFFLGSGSQAEYGTTNGTVDENYPCNPNTEYGKEKLHAYRELAMRAKNYRMRFIWTRIFSVYGVYDYPNTLIMSAIEKMKHNEPIEMTECVQLWDYLNVEDAVKAMKLFAISGCESGIYNIASGKYKPLREFVETIKNVIHSESNIVFGAIPYDSNGQVNLTPNVNKVKNALNWMPQIDFKTGIQTIYEKS